MYLQNFIDFITSYNSQKFIPRFKFCLDFWNLEIFYRIIAQINL